jgi:hypothetical protein
MSSEAKMRVKANRLLADWVRPYHSALPIDLIDAALVEAGFSPMEDAIYCGREGRVHEQVGPKTWLAMSWYRMEETNRYEITAYVS